MARIRTIKPEFWTSEQIAECSPNTRLLFIGMWSFCDDAGIHPANLKRLKMEVFPGDAFNNEDMETMVGELLDAGLINEYEVSGERFWIVTGWKHQKIDQPTYRHPKPDGTFIKSPNRRRTVADRSPDVRRTLDECSPPEGNGRESKGKKKTPSSANADTPAGFASFWLAWPSTPRKVDKAKCLKKWQRSGLETISATIIAHVERMKSGNRQWLEGYEPAPLTYLNGRRWEDGEIETHNPFAGAIN